MITLTLQIRFRASGSKFQVQSFRHSKTPKPCTLDCVGVWNFRLLGLGLSHNHPSRWVALPQTPNLKIVGPHLEGGWWGIQEHIR